MIKSSPAYLKNNGKAEHAVFKCQIQCQSCTKTQASLQTQDSLLQPGITNKDNQCKQAYYYNRGAKGLLEGEQVRVHLDTKHRTAYSDHSCV